MEFISYDDVGSCKGLQKAFELSKHTKQEQKTMSEEKVDLKIYELAVSTSDRELLEEVVKVFDMTVNEKWAQGTMTLLDIYKVIDKIKQHLEK